jgi:hypothetical protein
MIVIKTHTIKSSMSLEQDIISEKTPPRPAGISEPVYEHKGFLGIGSYKIIHEVSGNNSGWKDEYYRDPPLKKPPCKVLHNCSKTISQSNNPPRP